MDVGRCRACVIIVVALAAGCSSESGTVTVHRLLGRLLVHNVNAVDRSHEQRYNVRTEGGALWRLVLAEGVADISLPSGTLVQVSGISVEDDAVKTLLIGSNRDIMVQATVQGRSVIQSTLPSARQSLGRLVADIPVLAVIVDICNKGGGPALTKKKLEALMFDSSSRQPTLQSYYRTCSYGQATMDRTNSKVIGPVVLPCQGVMADGTRWGSSSCTDNDMYGWAEYVTNVTRAMGNIDLAQYRHIVLVLPKSLPRWAGTKCSWTGSGQVGPYSVNDATGAYEMSYVWISGDNAQDLASYFHELGHNLYLAHAGKGNCDYCDMSCDMGYCCSMRCYNSPHLWQLGWATPSRVVTVEDLAVGKPQEILLPNQLSTSQNMVVIQWRASRITTRLYLAYRLPGGAPYDSDLSPGFGGGVNVYNYTGGTPQTVEVTHHLGFVGRVGSQYRSIALGLQLRMESVDAQAQVATMALCKFTAEIETECADGVDNDCNGLVDMDDPACNSGDDESEGGTGADDGVGTGSDGVGGTDNTGGGAAASGNVTVVGGGDSGGDGGNDVTFADYPDQPPLLTVMPLSPEGLLFVPSTVPLMAAAPIAPQLLQPPSPTTTATAPSEPPFSNSIPSPGVGGQADVPPADDGQHTDGPPAEAHSPPPVKRKKRKQPPSAPPSPPEGLPQ